MKSAVKRFVCILLAVMSLSVCVPTFAEGETYPDVAGHWAQSVMLRGAADGYIAGSGGKLSPDGAITRAQAAVILCRVLGADKAADLTGKTDVPADSWYYEDMARAAYLGFITPSSAAVMAKPMTRQELFSVLCSAFSLELAKTDESALSPFSDAAGLASWAKNPAASLVSRGLLTGSGGKLRPGDRATRAEFLTMLYVVLDNFGVTACDKTRAEVKSGGSAVIISDSLAGVSSAGTCGSVIFAQSSGDANFSGQAEQVTVGRGEGAVTLSGSAKRVDITGDGRSVTINGSADAVYVSGKNVRLTIGSYAQAGAVEVLKSAADCSLTVNGQVKKLTVSASGCKASGSGSVAAADVASSDFSGAVCPGGWRRLGGAKVEFTAPETLKAGDKLEVSAKLTGVSGEITAQWYIDGKAADSSKVTVTEGTVLKFAPEIKYSAGMPDKAVISLALINTSGGALEYAASTVAVKLENYPASHYYQAEASRVLGLVKTCTDFKNFVRGEDYSSSDKEIWVNVKKYTSATDYLVWASLRCQKVNVFKKASDGWRLCAVYDCASGRSTSPTPTGMYKISYHSAKWDYGSYWCGPITGFYGGYAFHSWLNTSSGGAYDHTMGRPASHGCVRMPDAGARYMYTLPMGTTVVIY